MGFITIGVTCSRCNGNGIDPEHKTFNVESLAIYAYEDGPCQKCGGIGQIPLDVLLGEEK